MCSPYTNNMVCNEVWLTHMKSITKQNFRFNGHAVELTLLLYKGKEQQKFWVASRNKVLVIFQSNISEPQRFIQIAASKTFD